VVLAVPVTVVQPAHVAVLPRGWYSWNDAPDLLTARGAEAATLVASFRVRRDDPLGWSHQLRRGRIVISVVLRRACGGHASPSGLRLHLPLGLAHAEHARQESSPLAEDRFEGGIGRGYAVDLRVDYGEAQPSSRARHEVQAVLDELRFPRWPHQC
jgi:hypothetical protein